MEEEALNWKTKWEREKGEVREKEEREQGKNGGRMGEEEKV